ncbi:MAG: hypothetical protein CMF25_02005 [Kangiellaceae bacterium]|nr:hypothetical protein [Kangiellaceae bacterium]
MVSWDSMVSWESMVSVIGQVEHLMQLGGWVLWAILVNTLLLWWVLLDHFCFLRVDWLAKQRHWLKQWFYRREKAPWTEQARRRALLSEAYMALYRHLGLAKTLIALCPLFGLLGTVTGMIEVFDSLSIAGSASPRVMASGVSRATIPTMAGMVAALSGMLVVSRLKALAQQRFSLLKQQLQLEAGHAS